MSDLLFLLIDTSTSKGSIGISKDLDLIGIKYFSSDQSTIQEIHIFIQELLLENNITLHQINAIVLSKGPGSYTGLRIAYSVAKAVCYSLNLFLIEIDTLYSWRNFISKTKSISIDQCVGMMGARNNNAFVQKFENISFFLELNSEEKIKHFILEDKYYIGSAIDILSNFIDKKYLIYDIDFDVTCMIDLAIEKFTLSNFSDISYCEPLYIKPAFITISKKQIF